MGIKKNFDLINRFSLHLKEARMNQNISLEQLSDLTGFKPYTISRIEAGKYNLSADKLFVILNALNIHFCYEKN